MRVYMYCCKYMHTGNLGTSLYAMISNLAWQAIVNEFESYRVPHNSGLVSQLS